MSPSGGAHAPVQAGSQVRRKGWRAACLLAALLGASPSMAEEAATIRNRGFAVRNGQEVDAAVRVLAVDSVTVRAASPQVQVPAGTHVIEVSCTARVFAGMGTVDFDSKSTLTIRVAGGGSYQLDARVSVRGDCTPVLQ